MKGKNTVVVLCFLCAILFFAPLSLYGKTNPNSKAIGIELLKKARIAQQNHDKQNSRLLQAQKKLQLKVSPLWLAKTELQPVASSQRTINTQFSDHNHSLFENFLNCICGSATRIELGKKLLDEAIKKGDTDSVRRLSKFLHDHEKAETPIWKIILAIVLISAGIWQLFLAVNEFKKGS